MDTDPTESVDQLLEMIEDTVNVNMLYYGFHLQNLENVILEKWGLHTPMGDISHLYKDD
jgi:hypothetical protein